MSRKIQKFRQDDSIIYIICAVFCKSLQFHDYVLYICRWALGVLIYFMLKGEMPFGSWRESELDTFAKIAKGQLNLPQNFSAEAVDLITKVL